VYIYLRYYQISIFTAASIILLSVAALFIAPIRIRKLFKTGAALMFFFRSLEIVSLFNILLKKGRERDGLTPCRLFYIAIIFTACLSFWQPAVCKLHSAFGQNSWQQKQHKALLRFITAFL
jgi:hypothetical protein